MTEPERTRQRYRPSSVRILLIGEAPPASGRFFYHEDSGLYRAVRDSFLRVFPGTPGDGFLDAFRARGCYLVDLCARPVDKLVHAERVAARRRSEPRLSKLIAELSPTTIVTVVKAIVPNVTRAIERAGWHGDFYALPYPGQWHRHRAVFEQQLSLLLSP